jgi:hypothetical protein
MNQDHTRIQIKARDFRSKSNRNVAFNNKIEDFYVRLEISLEDKVYPKTYYRHIQDDIQVDETLAKI